MLTRAVAASERRLLGRHQIGLVKIVGHGFASDKRCGLMSDLTTQIQRAHPEDTLKQLQLVEALAEQLC